jgi:hypothetical protein
MSWVNILKKNDNEFQKEIEKKNIEEKKVIIINDPYIKNFEDEFDIEYSYKIINIKLEFKEYIEKLSLPFLDKNRIIVDYSYNFNDYIKYNSKNLIKIKNKIEKENEEYLKQLEDDEVNDYYENYEN